LPYKEALRNKERKLCNYESQKDAKGEKGLYDDTKNNLDIEEEKTLIKKSLNFKRSLSVILENNPIQSGCKKALIISILAI